MVNSEEKDLEELEDFYNVANLFYDNALMFIHNLVNSVLINIEDNPNAVAYNIELEEFIIQDLLTKDLSDFNLVKLVLANKLINQLKDNNYLFNYKKPKERIEYEKNYYSSSWIILREPEDNETFTLIDILEDVTDCSRRFIIDCLKEELAEIEEGDV